MKNIFFKFFLLTACSLIAISCEKHLLDKKQEPSTYSIKFDSPVEGGIYINSDSVNISAVAISQKSIHGYDIIVREMNDTTIHYFTHIHDHNVTLLINHKWKNHLSGARNMQAEVILYLDHDGNTGTKKAGFRMVN